MNENLDFSKNAEINEALKEFEAKEAVPSYQAVKFYKESATPKIVELAMKWTGFKEQKQAEYVLLGFVIVAIGVSLFLFLRGQGISSKPSTEALRQIEQMEQMQKSLGQ